MKLNKARLVGVLYFLLILSLNTINVSAATTEVSFTQGTEFIYKNEHYFLTENNSRVLDKTKWSKITVDKIIQSDDKAITNVTWSKYDVENVSLNEIEQNPALWKIGIKDYVSSINSSNPMSRFQSLFNEKSASLTELNKDVLLGKFGIFYTNELGYYNNAVKNWSANNTNTVLHNTMTPSIKDLQDRIIEGYLDGNAQIKLNGTYPGVENAEYNIRFHLKLYLVYGQESNILLSYNINFSIFESAYNQADTEIRKIIFWNIRTPKELTEDYPIGEIFQIGTYDMLLLSLIMIGTIFVVIVAIRKKKSIKTDQLGGKGYGF